MQFVPEISRPWVGNFTQGSSRLCTSVSLELGDQAAVVIAEGAGYLIDIEKRLLVRDLGWQVEHFWHQSDLQASIVSDGLHFEAFTSTKVLWRSRRVSWDGIKIVDRDGVIVEGEAYDPMMNTWPPFRLNLLDGSVEGGSYPSELSDAENRPVNNQGVGRWGAQLRAIRRRLLGR